MGQGGMIIGYDQNDQPITYNPNTGVTSTPPTVTQPTWTTTAQPPGGWTGGGQAGGGGSSGFGAGPITAPAAPPAPPPTPTQAPVYQHYGRTQGEIGGPTYQFNFGAPSGTPLGTGITPPQWEANWKPSTGSFADSIKYTMDIYHTGAQQAKNLIDAQKAWYKQFGVYPTGPDLDAIVAKALGSPTANVVTGTRRGGGGGYAYGGGGGGGGAPAVPPPIGPPKGNIGPPTITPFGASRDHVVLPENTLATLPDNIRPIFDQLMRRLGYQGVGNYGQFGEREYIIGPNGPQPWTDSLILSLAGGDVVTQAWLRWIASALGLSGAQAGWPGAGTIGSPRPSIPEFTTPNVAPGTITAPTG